MKKDTTIKAKKKPSNKQQALILGGVTFGFLIIIYIFATVYFSSHFFFGTTINGMNCERMSVDEVKDRMQDYISRYSLTLLARNDQKESISADELGMKYVDDGGVEALMKDQNPLAWIIYAFKPVQLEVSANKTYDNAIVSTIVDELNCTQPENIIAPKNAEITEAEGKFSITPEVLGTTIRSDVLISAIIEAVDNGKTELNLDEADVYVNPTIYSDDEELTKKLAALNMYAVADITYDFEDNRIYRINSSVLKDWVVLADDGSYILDEEQVYAYVKQMAYDTDTFGLAHDFKTTSGATIKLAKGGDYGWVINRDKTTEALIEAIKSQTTGTLEPIYKYEGKARGINDIGGTYVEVCIEKQKMWCYKDGELVVETNVVTGNHSQGYDTPSGSVWAIDAKKKDVDFKQYDVNVTFWLPFNGGVGIHDASWRWDGEYVPSTYLTNGSHGCVNTPYNAAEKIFNTVDIGYPVVVYYSVDQPVGPQPTQHTSVG